VVRAYGRFFWVQTSLGQLQCALRESIRAQADSKLSPVVVGDEVDVELVTDIASPEDLEKRKPHGVIAYLHPRHSKFSRPKRGLEEMEQIVAANIDQMLIVSSTARPQFKMGLIDRFLIAAHQGSLKPFIIMNKVDLEHELDLERLKQIYGSIEIPLITTSVTAGIGLDSLVEILKDRHSVILGQSGVGKSSLLNAVDPGLDIKVGEISEYSQKGTHTTSSVEMYPLSFGGYVVDTPGLKYLGLWDIDAEDIRYLYPEINEYAQNCRFRDCMHKSEPGCAVKEALEKNEIFPERYESYLKIVEELKKEDSY
jgi:ribosome biogenesis GTPase